MKKIIKNFNISVIKQSIALMGSQGKIYMLFIFGFCGIELCCTVLSTAGTKGVINAVTELNMKKFWLPMSYIIIKNLLWWIYAPISSYVTAKISKRTLCSIKTNLAEHMVRLSMRYHDNKPTGELLSVLSNDIRCLSGIYDWSLFQVLRSAIGGIGGVVVMTVIDWRFSIVVFSLGTISVYLSSYYSKKLEAAGRKQQEQLAKTSVDAYELVRAAKTIRLFHMEGYKEADFIKTLEKEADVKRKSGKISAKMNSAITMVNLLSYAAILFIGALFVYWDLTDWGTVIALLGLKEITDMLFVEFGQFMAEMQVSVAGAKRIFEIMDSREEEPSNIYVSSNSPETALSMENIDFAYDEANPVLCNFNLSLKSRGLTVLAGESGAGKSTIMKLILGLYTPDGGTISFYNPNGKYKSLREAAAYVPQEPMLFQGTIYDNIALGNPKATEDMVITAAKMAGADEFITKLNGSYAAEVLDNGISLSGGQKQRIAIARALLKNSEILLLDEITSGLDHETEEGIINIIKIISKNRAVLFITHNPDIIKRADEIKRVNVTHWVI